MAKKKISSYQKMKEKYEKKIQELTGDIITLIDEKDLMETNLVKLKWKLKLNIEKAIWHGDNNM